MTFRSLFCYPLPLNEAMSEFENLRITQMKQTVIKLIGALLLLVLSAEICETQKSSADTKAIGIEEAVRDLPDSIRTSNRYALVIGTGEYEDKRIPALPAGSNDARRLYEILIDPAVGMFPEENVTLLLHEEVTRMKVVSALDTLARRAENKDLVVIFFSGHGAVDDRERSYWVMQNTKSDDLRASALSETEITELLNEIRTSRLVTLIDACYSASTAKIGTSKSLVDLKKIYPEFRGEGRVAITSSKGDQLSVVIKNENHPGFGYSAFTWHVVSGMKGEGDSDKDGVVTVSELWDYVKDRTEATARQQGGDQQPQLKGQIGSKFLLTVDGEQLVANSRQTRTAMEQLLRLLGDRKITTAQYDEGRRLLKASEDRLDDMDRQRRRVYLDLARGELSVRYLGAALDAIELPEQLKVCLEQEVREPAGLKKGTNAQAPVLWSTDIGLGYASAEIFSGRIYLLDNDSEAQTDVVRCLSLQDGRDIWQYSFPVSVKSSHRTMSWTGPAVTDKYVVTLGPKAYVTCLDSKTGAFRWMYDLVREFNTMMPEEYVGQCPLIDDGKAIIASVGDILMTAVDCETGNFIWQTPNPDGWVMTHSSIIPMEFKGRRFYICCGGDSNRGGVIGVYDQDGSVLWKTEEWKLHHSVLMPIVAGKDRIFLTAGYGQRDLGCAMLRLVEIDGNITAEMEFFRPIQVFGLMQKSPIFYGGNIFGVRPDGELVCLDLDGNVVWTSMSANKFGGNGGLYAIERGLLYVMNDDGDLILVKASPTGYIPLARAKIPNGNESWNLMAIASNRIILRDHFKMICLDISHLSSNL